MYIKQIKLHNVKCFDDLTLDFIDDSNKIRKWTAFLGINGVGKSILLQAITLSLTGDPALIHDLVPNSHYWVRKHKEMGTIDVIASVTNESTNFKQRDFHLRYLVLSQDTKIKNQMFPPRIIPDPEHDGHQRFYEFIDNRRNRAIFCSYGPYRRLPNKLEKQSGIRDFASFNSIASMFYSDVLFIDLNEWLKDLDYRQIKFKDKTAEKLFSQAIKTLSSVIPRTKFDSINKRGEAMFVTPSGIVPFSELSDGFRSIISWVLNLFISIVEANSNKDNPLHSEGVVLVDELDLHLHPQGQRKIVDWLRKTFPNIQFIVSSHSPFIAQSLKQGELFVLKTQRGKTAVEQIHESFEGWRVDQILTTIFGLESTRDVRTERKLRKYEEMSNSEFLEQSQKKIIVMEKLKRDLEFIIPYPGETKSIMKKQEELDYLIKKFKEKMK